MGYMYLSHARQYIPIILRVAVCYELVQHCLHVAIAS